MIDAGTGIEVLIIRTTNDGVTILDDVIRNIITIFFKLCVKLLLALNRDRVNFNGEA